MELAISEKNRKIVIYENFVYHLKYSGKVKETWVCKNRKCPGKLILFKESDLKILKKHSHNIDLQEIKKISLNQELKNLALSTTYHPRDVFDKVILQNAEATTLNKKSVYKRINNLRKHDSSNQGNLSGSEIPLHLTVTYSKEDFLLYESENMKIFTTTDNLLRLKKSETWIADGTFLSSPIGFEQIYIIYGFVFKKCVPLVYVLMKNKTEDSYNEALRVLRSKLDFYVPDEIIVDNEAAAKVAFKKNFPGIKIVGCLTHFSASIYRNLMKFNLAFDYKNNSSFYFTITKLKSLVFVPEEFFEIEFQKIIQIIQSFKNSRMEEFLIYFRKIIRSKKKFLKTNINIIPD